MSNPGRMQSVLTMLDRTQLRRWAIVVRILTMVPVICSLLWDVLTFSGLLMAMIGSTSAILLAEWPILSKLRFRVLIGGVLLSLLSVWGLQGALLSQTAVSNVFTPEGVLWIDTLVWAGLGFGAVVLFFRLLAKRSGFWFFLEMGLIALGTAYIFFPHQYKIVIRPLWLSDLAWSIGLEPSVALGIVGMCLASILSILTVLEQSKRRHLSVALFPVLALLALIFVDPLEMDTPPPPKQLEDILGGSSTDNQGNGGQGGGQGGQAGENDQNMNSGQNEKQSGSSGSPKPIAVVLLGDDYVPDGEVFYFRQEIQSEYNGFRLIAPRNSEIPYDAARGFPTVAEEYALPPSTDEYRKRVLSDVALLTPHTAPFMLESPISYTPTVNPRPGRFTRTYRVESAALNVGYEHFLDLHVGEPTWPTPYWEHLTAIPQDARYAQLAQSIVASLPEEYKDNLVAQAFAVKLFLDEQTRYTMSERHENASDPTGEFLFGPHQQYTGYCVHTSHAAVFLWRALGIPARVGVGYAVPAEQQQGSALLMMDRDAHSWPEFYIEELGWVILDVAPQTVLDEQGDPPDLNILDALEELARAEADSQFRRAINWKQLWVQYKDILQQGILGIVMVVFLALSLRKVRRRWWYLYTDSTYWVYISALDALSEQGWIRQFGESPEHFARRIQKEVPSFTGITWAYIASIYGEDGEDGEDDKARDVSMLRQNRQQLSVEIRHHTSGWRWLGWCNLLSVWNSR